MSTKKIPLLHEVIPVIDILTEVLEEVVLRGSNKLKPAVKVGAAKGLAVLNKYYSKTDESIMYRIAISK